MGKLLKNYCCWICPTIVKIKFNLIPYFTRLIIVDRVGLFEPTTSAGKLSKAYQRAIRDRELIPPISPVSLYMLSSPMYLQVKVWES